MVSYISLMNRVLFCSEHNFSTVVQKIWCYDTHILLVQGPHLEYYILLWSPQHKKDMEWLEVVQRRATEKIKMIEQLRELELFRLQNRRLWKDNIAAFLYFKGL